MKITRALAALVLLASFVAAFAQSKTVVTKTTHVGVPGHGVTVTKRTVTHRRHMPVRHRRHWHRPMRRTVIVRHPAHHTTVVKHGNHTTVIKHR